MQALMWEARSNRKHEYCPVFSGTRRGGTCAACCMTCSPALGLGVFEFSACLVGTPQHLMILRTALKGSGEFAGQHKRSGKGVILVSAHFTTLEICVRLLCRDVEINGMYRPHDSDALEWAVKKARARYTKQMFSRDELRPALRCLKQGGVLWFAPDQETRRGENVFVPFFNQSASSLTSTHQMARTEWSCSASLFPSAKRRWQL